MTPDARDGASLEPGEALVLFGVSAVLMLFVGGLLGRLGLTGIALSEWLLLAAPAVGLARVRGGVRRILGLRWPGGRALVGAALVGAATWYLLSWAVLPIQEAIAPAPPELRKALEELTYGRGTPQLTAVLALALTPACCEELLCRGALARALARRTGTWPALALSAALFALLHLSPYRFVPTFLLGLVLGWATLATRSLVPAMIIHLLNNAAVVLLAPEKAPAAWFEAHANLIGVGALILVSTGLYLLKREA